MSKQDREGYSARPAPYSVSNRSRFRLGDTLSIFKNVVPEWITKFTRGESADDNQRRVGQRDAAHSDTSPRSFASLQSERSSSSTQQAVFSTSRFNVSQRASETPFKLPNVAPASPSKRAMVGSTELNSHNVVSTPRGLGRIPENLGSPNETIYEDASNEPFFSMRHSPANRVVSASASRSGASSASSATPAPKVTKDSEVRSSRKREHSFNDDDSTSGISSNNDADIIESGRLRPQPSNNGPSRFSQFLAASNSQLDRSRRVETGAAAGTGNSSKRARYLELAPTNLRHEVSSAASNRSGFERAYSPFDGRSSGATTPLFSPRFRHALSVASDQRSFTDRLSSSVAPTDPDSSYRFAALLGSRLSASFSARSVASTSTSTASGATLRRRTSRPAFDPQAASTDFLGPLLNAAQSNSNSTLSKSASAQFTPTARVSDIDSRRAADRTPSGDARSTAAVGNSTAKLILDRLSQLDSTRRDRPAAGSNSSLSLSNSLQSFAASNRAPTSAAELQAVLSARSVSMTRADSNTRTTLPSTTISKETNSSNQSSNAVIPVVAAPAATIAAQTAPTASSIADSAAMPSGALGFFKVPNAVGSSPSSGEFKFAATSFNRSDAPSDLFKFGAVQPADKVSKLEPFDSVKVTGSPLQFQLPQHQPTQQVVVSNDAESDNLICGGKMRQKRYLGSHLSGNPMSTSHQFVAGSGGGTRAEDMDSSDRLEMPDLPAVSLPPLAALPTFRFASPYGFPPPATTAATSNTTTTNGHSLNVTSAGSSPVTFSFSKPVSFGSMTSSPIQNVSKLAATASPMNTEAGSKADVLSKPNGFSFTFSNPIELLPAGREEELSSTGLKAVNDFRSQLRFCDPLILNGSDSSNDIIAGGSLQLPVAQSGERVIRKALRRPRQ